MSDELIELLLVFPPIVDVLFGDSLIVANANFTRVRTELFSFEKRRVGKNFSEIKKKVLKTKFKIHIVGFAFLIFSAASQQKHVLIVDQITYVVGKIN